MPIVFSCSCGAKLQARDGASGSVVDCPKCGESIAVPDEAGGLKRRASSPDPGESPGSVIASSAAAVVDSPYGSCRTFQTALYIGGVLSLFGSALLAVIGVANFATSDTSSMAVMAVTTLVAALLSVLAGFACFAGAELLGGVVAFLLKNDCRP